MIREQKMHSKQYSSLRDAVSMPTTRVSVAMTAATLAKETMFKVWVTLVVL